MVIITVSESAMIYRLYLLFKLGEFFVNFTLYKYVYSHEIIQKMIPKLRNNVQNLENLI